MFGQQKMFQAGEEQRLLHSVYMFILCGCFLTNFCFLLDYFYSSAAVASEVTAELAAQLQRTVLSIESALKKIKQAEAVLNKTDAVTTGALTYSTHKSVRLQQMHISFFYVLFAFTTCFVYEMSQWIWSLMS